MIDQRTGSRPVRSHHRAPRDPDDPRHYRRRLQASHHQIGRRQISRLWIQSGSAMPRWYVYIIECRDGSLYTGIATDVERRYAAHVAGKGARYTRSHPPSRLLARFEYPDRAGASKAEYAIKQFTPARKRALCASACAKADSNHTIDDGSAAEFTS